MGGLRTVNRSTRRRLAQRHTHIHSHTAHTLSPLRSRQTTNTHTLLPLYPNPQSSSLLPPFLLPSLLPSLPPYFSPSLSSALFRSSSLLSLPCLPPSPSYLPPSPPSTPPTKAGAHLVFVNPPTLAVPALDGRHIPLPLQAILSH